MRFKIITTIFIYFHSSLCFSQTSKVNSYEWHYEVPDRPATSCRMPSAKGGFETIIVYLFPDSTFLCTYKSDGNLHPDCKTSEAVRGHIIVKNGSTFLVRNSGGNDFLTDSLRSRLEQLFAIDFSTRIEYSDEMLLAYNSVNPYLVFRKTNFFARDKRNKIFSKPTLVFVQY